MLLQVFRASTEYSTNSYCTTDLCTDCKDSEKVVQHIESNSACFLSSGSASEPVQNSLEKHCLVGRIGKRRGKRVDRRQGYEVEHRSTAPVGPSQQQFYYGSFFFFLNRALVCFLIPHSFCEQLQHARHCYRYWRNSHEQRPSFCGAYILVGLSLLLKYFILLKVLAGPDFFLPDRNKRNDRNVKHCLFQIHIEKRVVLSGIWSSSSWGIYFVFCKRG